MEVPLLGVLQVFGAYGLSGRLGWRSCCQLLSAGPMKLFFMKIELYSWVRELLG